MIENDKQYQVTREQAEKFAQDLAKPPSRTNDLLLAGLEANALRSQLQELREQMAEYERRTRASPVKIFVSYARKNREHPDLVGKFLRELDPMKHNPAMPASIWFDDDISPGEVWSDEIENSLKSVGIALFLITSEFVQSDYCKREWAVIKDRWKADKKSVVLVPVWLSPPANWKELEYSKFEGVPKRKPVSEFRNKAQGCKEAITDLQPVIKASRISWDSPQGTSP